MKSKGLAYLLWFFGGFGIFGIHRFYLGKIGTGILWLCTIGVFGFGAFFDLFTLGSQVDAENAKKELKEIRTATLANVVSNK
ncbi:NINE protein [Leptospira interrogans]|uniref:NINE protein n=1 Tax=Leptospira interrogans TaxID=173 RepID=UPI00027858C1|nr:NINE protein [Leptospira interrogans]EJP16414.1 TM2 domain protein [Leptospira interrogans str. FPW2026]